MSFLLTFILSALLGVIPAPASMQVRGGSFKVNPDAMEFVLDKESALPPEGYTIEVTRKRVKAMASTEAGLFYARQTLRQLEKDGRIPCVSITDYPRFSWRGFHIDPCRHFLSVEEIKKQIDILSAYKMNVMHWHLTDDQGWRIEIKRYPRLTQVGAFRREFDGSRYGGFYTQEEIRDVVAYAARHHVTVIPEIEMPGHARAAIAAYPALSCTKETEHPQCNWGSPDIAMCPGSEFTFEFLAEVMDEVCALFPSEYIHIGGDECRKVRWEKCAACQARIRSLGLRSDSSSTAEEKLQSYAVRRMEEILQARGRKLVGWDEILEGGLSPNATVMSWRGMAGGIAAALEGHDVVMTPSKDGMYLDHFQGDPKIEPVSIGNYTTLQKAYLYEPVSEELVLQGKDGHVLGLQCNLWSEYLYTDAQREYMLFPRAFAVAETAWTLRENKDWERFRVNVEAACEDLDRRGVNYHIPLPEQPGGSCSHLAFTDFTEVEFTTTRPVGKVVYTLDGSNPTARSARYGKPLRFTESATLKVASVTPYGKLSPVRTIDIRKMEPLPALSSAESGGLRAWRADGRFSTVAETSDAAWREVPLRRLKDLNTLEPFDRNVPEGTVFYAARAEGLFEVKDTGVYRFSSDCDQVWVDGELLIDNGAQTKRYSREDAELALEKGRHRVQVYYIFNLLGGWNTLRGKTDVLIRKEGTDKWHNIDIR